MSAVAMPPPTNVGGAAPPTTDAPAAGAPASSSGAADLLPEPSGGGLVDIDMLYLMMAEQNKIQQLDGKTRIEADSIAKKAAREAQQKAEEDAKKHTGGFFASILPIAKIAAIVAAAVATVCTWGAASPVLVGVALALSAGGMVVSETKCLDGVLGKNWSAYIGAGMAIGGSLLTAGANLGLIGATTAASTTTKTVGAAASIAGGAAKIGEGGATVAVAIDEHAGDMDMIKAKKQEQLAQLLQRDIEDVIVQLEDSKDNYRQNSEKVNNIVQTIDDTGIIAAGGPK